MNSESLQKIAKYCSRIGESPLFALSNLPQDLNKELEVLTKEVKSSAQEVDTKKYYHPSSPELGYIIKTISDVLEKEYIKTFLDFNSFIKLFNKNFPELTTKVDKIGDDQGLLKICHDIIPNKQWAEFNKNAIFISRSLPGHSNSTLQLADILFSLVGTAEIELKIRPDCFRIQPASSMSCRFEYADWYGKPFNLKWVKSLKEEQIAEHGPNRTGALSDGHCTQFLWSPRKDSSIHLSMEELPFKAENTLEESEETIFTRFVHAIFDPRLEMFTHFDGAMHIYKKTDYQERIAQNLKSYNKNYHKAKIFRIDGKVDYDDFRHVIGAFYKWNWMATEYFSPSNKESS